MSAADPELYAQALAELQAIPTRTRKPGAPSGVRCGTYSGYNQHKKRREVGCEDCLEAKREYYRTYYAAHKARIRKQRKGGAA